MNRFEETCVPIPATTFLIETPGRMKENVCGDKMLKDTAMSASSLSAMSFELPPGFQHTSRDTNKNSDIPDSMYCSSSSSTCTRDSDTGTCSDVDSSNISGQSRQSSSHFDCQMSDKLNAKVTLRLTSRQGRSSQRWVTESSEMIRLVTGCVPILKGGKIMFVSASGKPEWILPKGGWELDESLEESAVRECFEEAGVLGILGPRLKPVEYETRKARKRRMEKEQELSKRAVKARIDSVDNKNGMTSSSDIDDAISDLPQGDDTRLHGKSELCGNSSEASEGSPSTYSKVRMTLFPLYVSRVFEKWPEDGRFRKAVDIDEAIELLERRPEFKEILEEVKSRGLHLLSPPGMDSDPSLA